MGNWTYIILTQSERDAFAELVNEYIQLGWKPLGGPFITTFANGHGNVHAFHPATERGFDDLTIYIEYNQAMTMDSVASEGELSNG